MERADLYRCIPPEGILVPIMVTPEDVDNGFPEEMDIEEVMRGLKGGREGGMSVIQEKDIKGWLRESLREKNSVRRRWRLLVRIIQRTFEDGMVPEEVMWSTMGFLPTVRGEY